MSAINVQNETLAAGLARLWMRCYTAGLASDVRERREQQLESDLWEHHADRFAAGTAASMVGLEVIGRTVRGMPADLLWRFQLEGPKMEIKIPFERAAGMLLLALVILLPVSTAISGYNTDRNGWESELIRIGELSDLAVAMNHVFHVLAATGLLVAAVLFYLTLAPRSRNLAAISCALMFAAGVTTLAASAAYYAMAELAEEYVARGAQDGIVTSSRGFALAMEALVGFTIFMLATSIYVLAIVAYRERLVPRWTLALVVASPGLIAAALLIDVFSDSDSAWLFLMGGLVTLLVWLIVAGFSLLLGARGKGPSPASPSLAPS